MYYSQNPDYQINNEQVTNLKNKVSQENDITEEEVYDVLKLYLDELGIYNMQIRHSFSSNKQGTGSNIWLHPDWVAWKFLIKNGVQ